MEHETLLYEAIRRYAARLLGNCDTAQDIVQEVFLRLEQQKNANGKRDTNDERDANSRLRSTRAFAYRIARNLVIDQFRKKKTSDLPEDIPAQATLFNPVALTEQKETNQMIQEKMNALPPRHREVLRLKFQEGLKYAEIAEVIGEPVTTVAWLIHEAVSLLRKELRVNNE